MWSTCVTYLLPTSSYASELVRSLLSICLWSCLNVFMYIIFNLSVCWLFNCLSCYCRFTHSCVNVTEGWHHATVLWRSSWTMMLFFSTVVVQQLVVGPINRWTFRLSTMVTSTLVWGSNDTMVVQNTRLDYPLGMGVGGGGGLVLSKFVIFCYLSLYAVTWYAHEKRQIF